MRTAEVGGQEGVINNFLRAGFEDVTKSDRARKWRRERSVVLNNELLILSEELCESTRKHRMMNSITAPIRLHNEQVRLDSKDTKYVSAPINIHVTSNAHRC